MSELVCMSVCMSIFLTVCTHLFMGAEARGGCQDPFSINSSNYFEEGSLPETGSGSQQVPEILSSLSNTLLRSHRYAWMHCLVILVLRYKPWSSQLWPSALIWCAQSTMLSNDLYVCLYIHPSTYLFTYPFIHPSTDPLSIFIFIIIVLHVFMCVFKWSLCMSDIRRS